MQDNEQAECLSNVPNSFLVHWGYYPLAELNRSQNVFIIHTLMEEEGFCLTHVNGTIDWEELMKVQDLYIYVHTLKNKGFGSGQHRDVQNMIATNPKKVM